MTGGASSKRRIRETLDPWRAQAWFVEPERAESGELVPVATIFLTNRECPWRCIYCDLWKGTTTERVPPGAIPAQIDFALVQPGLATARHIKLYNAGSFFDPGAIPPEDFPAIAARVARFERVIVECHPALVGPAAVSFRDALPPTAVLEVAMGLEVADDALLARLNKRMTLALFRQAAQFLVGHGMAVRAFVIVKPPFVTSEEDALRLAWRSLDFAFDCGASVVSLIPARPGPVELEEMARAGDFAPPTLTTFETAVTYGVGLGRGRILADLWDAEKLFAGSDRLGERLARLHAMNLSQRIDSAGA